MTDLSIVVVTWNTRDLVLECLASIEAELRRDGGSPDLSAETCVVDNASSDGTQEAIRRRFPWVQLVSLPRNVGFAAGSNAGLRALRGRHALLLNSDARLERGVLSRCVDYLDAHPDVGVVGPQLLNPDGSKQNSIHNFPMLATELLPKGIFQYLFRRRFPSRRWAGDSPIDVEAVAGAALFLRASLLREVGPLPEEYFFFLEETDWCLRVGGAGWRVVHLPDVFVTHLSGGSSKRRSPALTRIEYHRSLYRFFRKHHGRVPTAAVLGLRFAKASFYLATQAPLVLAGERHRERWAIHRQVLAWHLRGCPATVGLGGSGASQGEAHRRGASRPARGAGADAPA
jgi:GT2 family glycosyltransferase